MQLEITTKKENKALQRTEITAKLTGFDATPSRPQVIDELAKKVAATKQCILVTKIDAGYGARSATVYAQVCRGWIEQSVRA